MEVNPVRCRSIERINQQNRRRPGMGICLRDIGVHIFRKDSFGGLGRCFRESLLKAEDADLLRLSIFIQFEIFCLQIANSLSGSVCNYRVHNHQVRGYSQHHGRDFLRWRFGLGLWLRWTHFLLWDREDYGGKRKGSNQQEAEKSKARHNAPSELLPDSHITGKRRYSLKCCRWQQERAGYAIARKR